MTFRVVKKLAEVPEVTYGIVVRTLREGFSRLIVVPCDLGWVI